MAALAPMMALVSVLLAIMAVTVDANYVTKTVAMETASAMAHVTALLAFLSLAAEPVTVLPTPVLTTALPTALAPVVHVSALLDGLVLIAAVKPGHALLSTAAVATVLAVATLVPVKAAMKVPTVLKSHALSTMDSLAAAMERANWTVLALAQRDGLATAVKPR